MLMQKIKLSSRAGEKYKTLGSQDANIFHVLCINCFSCVGIAYSFFNPSLWILILCQVHKCCIFCFLYSRQENNTLDIFVTHCLVVIRKTTIVCFVCWKGSGYCPLFHQKWGRWIIEINIFLFLTLNEF